MTAREVPEHDWKIFRRLREEALEAFSRQILNELVTICSERNRTAYERYGEVHRLLRDRDRSMAEAFDYLSRSRMLQHLAAMRELGLVRPEDLTGMSHQTQDRIRLLTEGSLG
jgi:hypothetical protein